MSKSPAVLFYTSDFLTGTYELTYEQRGKYITMLCVQHQRSDNEIPESLFDRTIQGDNDIMSKFIKTPTGYYNQRMREESDKRKSFCNSRKESIKKRYVSNTNEHTYVERMENENINENEFRLKGVQGEKEKKPEINIPFEAFWNLYDKKRDKDKCAERWNSLTDIERQRAIDYIPAYKNATEKQFRKDPIRFLKNKSWNDEIISPQNFKTYQTITQPIKPDRNENIKQIEHNLKEWETRTPEQIKLDTIGGDAIKYRILNPGHANQYTQDETIEMFIKGELTL